jgi:UDP-N-acetylmuramate--alanine ligase
MSGIAELLANLGYVVSGSDAKRSDVTARLESACGVTVFEGTRRATWATPTWSSTRRP